ncbi:cyclin-D5-2-like isoform X2 [Phalaenopsis equestris]|uniref:cyclin-D5-2-like isoform X2 n=1 Tax=Phalaenopsis equestris TaxID=78828 RepID=UPI0009E2A4B0|nr:cyclin-D5-2-like isoform X2 [Phalaenopsis equestris]
MEFPKIPFSLPSLFCPEDGSLLATDKDDGELDDGFIFFNDSSFNQTDEQYIDVLFSKESSLLCHHLSAKETYLLPDRSESVRWILKMKSYFRFGSQTAYLAVTYMNRFFLRRAIDEEKNWATRLLSIACLSLAAKMEECSPPLLPEYCLEDSWFSSESIRRMELLVLDTLEWKLHSVTPFAYFSYFASKFNFNRCSKDLFSKATSFIFLVLEAMNLMLYRPSAISAAAILAASGDRLTKTSLESKICSTSISESLKEQVFSCYNAMIQQSNKKKKIGSRKTLFLSDASENCSKRRKLQ